MKVALAIIVGDMINHRILFTPPTWPERMPGYLFHCAAGILDIFPNALMIEMAYDQSKSHNADNGEQDYWHIAYPTSIAGKGGEQPLHPLSQTMEPVLHDSSLSPIIS